MRRALWLLVWMAFSCTQTKAAPDRDAVLGFEARVAGDSVGPSAGDSVGSADHGSPDRSSGEQPRADSAALPDSGLPASIALGVYIAGAPGNPSNIDTFATLVGAKPKNIMWYQGWTPGSNFNTGNANAVVSRGATPIITWEPWDYTGGVNQPTYALSKIIGGSFDAYIHQYAKDVAAWGKPLYLRWAHEMNGDWYPWCAGVNGNTAAQYGQAWRHIHDLFVSEKANNVRWIWSPNTITGTSSYASLYPGDAYVDWVALDGYNWGTTQSWSSWTSLVQVFDKSYSQLVALTKKPIMIAETASTETGGDKAAWIRQGFLVDLAPHLPRIQSVVWFNENKETDWRVNSSTAALAAFKEVVAAPLYQGTLP
jgi:beta-mannanase